jgi:hypothetical protein
MIHQRLALRTCPPACTTRCGDGRDDRIRRGDDGVFDELEEEKAGDRRDVQSGRGNDDVFDELEEVEVAGYVFYCYRLVSGCFSRALETIRTRNGQSFNLFLCVQATSNDIYKNAIVDMSEALGINPGFIYVKIHE